MATNTSKELSYKELVEISFGNLERTYGASWGLFSTGTLAVVTNILVWITIAKNKHLHNVCFSLIFQLAIADFIAGGAYVITAVKRLYRYYARIPEVNSQVGCALEMFFPYLGQCASLSMALMVAFERMMTTLGKPTDNPKRRGISLTVFGWLYAIIDSLCMFSGISDTKLIPSCMLVASVSETFYKIQAKHHVGQVFVISGMYAIVLGYVHYQVSQAKKENAGNLAEIKKKFEVRLGRMLAVIGVLYLITQIITWSILGAMSHLPPHVRASYGPYVRSIIISNSGVNFLVYVTMSTEFKKGFYTVIGKENRVEPTNVKAKPKQQQRNGKYEK